MSGQNDLIAGRYRLVHRVGRGGMGVVWEAWDERLHRKVAVKQLHAQLGLSDADTELANLRAMREARITARLDHPHAVPVFDVVEHEGQPCLIMQFLPSTPLSEVLRERQTLPLTETARIGAQIASALAAAHRAGIVHRDVKPGNVLIAEDGTARISDFGISHALGDTTLTATGMVHGTPAYLAPEVARGSDSTFASDVFGLGATLYTASEGAPPFGKDQNSIALLHKVASGVFAAPTRSGPLTPLLLQMLAADPAERPDMGEVARSLTSLAAQSGVEPDTLRFAEADISTVASDVRRPERPWSRGTAPTQLSPVPVAAEPEAATAAVTPDAAPDRVVEPAEQPPGRPAGQPPDYPPGHPPGPPPTASAPLPPEPAPPRRRGLLWAGLAVIALLGLAVLVYALVPAGDPGRAGGSTTSASTASDAPRSSAAETASSSSSASPTPLSPTSDAPSPTPAPSSAAATGPTTASTTGPTTSPTTDPPSASSTSTASSKASQSASSSASASKSSGSKDNVKVSGRPTAKQLSRAITSYYNLMPGNTDRGWSRLTSSYQRNRANGRSSYERFWGAMDRVSVSGVRGNPPDRAVATIRYVYKSGRVVREITSFQLVKDGGELKINRSTVLSSS